MHKGHLAIRTLIETLPVLSPTFRTEHNSRSIAQRCPEYRTGLRQALRDSLTGLGLLGWEFKDQFRRRSARPDQLI